MNAKKLLLGTLGVVASLGMSSNTLAYFGETAAYDYPSGFYLGLQLGYAQTWWKDLNGLTDAGLFIFDGSAGSTAAGRVLFGYEFNEFFAVEMGYAYFRSGIVTVADTPIAGPNAEVYNKRMKSSTIDAVGKISLPLDNGFRLYTKAGIHYTMSNGAPTFIGGAPWVVDDPNRKVANVTFGVGVGYAVTPAFSVDASWVYYRGNSDLSSDKYYPDTDFYSLGLTYKFLCS